MAGKIARPRRAATGPQKKNPKLSKMHANRDVKAASGPTKWRSDPGKVMEVHTWEPHILKPPELAIALPGTRGNFFQGIAKCVQIRRSSDWRSNKAADRTKKNQGDVDMEASQHGLARPGFGRAWDAREFFKRGEGVGVKYPEVNPTAKNEDSRGGSERTNL